MAYLPSAWTRAKIVQLAEQDLLPVATCSAESRFRKRKRDKKKKKQRRRSPSLSSESEGDRAQQAEKSACQERVSEVEHCFGLDDLQGPVAWETASPEVGPMPMDIE